MIRPGLVSVSFRSLNPGEIIALVAKARLDAIEWGGDIHVPPRDLANAREVREATLGAGVPISSYGSYYRLAERQSSFEPVLETAIVSASVVTASDFSGIRDLGSTVVRTARALEALPNSNLINAKTTVPQLLGEVAAGETILITGVLALGNPEEGQAAWIQLPQVPRLGDLEEIIRDKGSQVSTMKHDD